MYRTEYDGSNCVRNGPKYLGVVANGASKAAGMKITAEKYEVPYANAVSQGPTDLPPNTMPCTDFELRLFRTPIKIITAKYASSIPM